MPIFSKPLCYPLRMKKGEIIWTEVTERKLPTLKKRFMFGPMYKLTVFFIFVFCPSMMYLDMQLEFNPKAWYSKYYGQAKDIISIRSHLGTPTGLLLDVAYIKEDSFIPDENKEKKEQNKEGESICAEDKKKSERLKVLKRLGFTF